VVLTAIPFWLVMGEVLPSPGVTALVIMGFAVIQVVVHMIYFLHMNTKSEGGWTFLALIFTVTIVAITLSGSIWVMYHLNTNMMPGMMTGEVSTTPSGAASPFKRAAAFTAEMAPRLVPTTHTAPPPRARTAAITRPSSSACAASTRWPPRLSIGPVRSFGPPRSIRTRTSRPARRAASRTASAIACPR